MKFFRLFIFLLIIHIMPVSCKQAESKNVDKKERVTSEQVENQPTNPSAEGSIGGLLLTQFTSLEELKEVISIEYITGSSGILKGMFGKAEVRLRHQSGREQVISILSSGVDEGDFNQARDGGILDRGLLAIKTPFAVINRKDLVSIELLGRRRYEMFGEGDIAFYDLAEQMVKNIKTDYKNVLSEKDLSEKGYLNSFNHIVAQAIMTAAFSERLAEFVADVHERYTMPELITGIFTEDQLKDLEKGPVDNYVDMINNEWGQKLGKRIKKKYEINTKTLWTPSLLTAVLNDIQRHCSFAFAIGFNPFKESDDMVVRFANKINLTKAGVSEYIQYYFDRIKLNMDCQNPG